MMSMPMITTNTISLTEKKMDMTVDKAAKMTNKNQSKDKEEANFE